MFASVTATQPPQVQPRTLNPARISFAAVEVIAGTALGTNSGVTDSGTKVGDAVGYGVNTLGRGDAAGYEVSTLGRGEQAEAKAARTAKKGKSIFDFITASKKSHPTALLIAQEGFLVHRKRTF